MFYGKVFIVLDVKILHDFEFHLFLDLYLFVLNISGRINTLNYTALVFLVSLLQFYYLSTMELLKKDRTRIKSQFTWEVNALKLSIGREDHLEVVKPLLLEVNDYF